MAEGPAKKDNFRGADGKKRRTVDRKPARVPEPKPYADVVPNVEIASQIFISALLYLPSIFNDLLGRENSSTEVPSSGASCNLSIPWLLP